MRKVLYRWLARVTKHPQEQRNIVSLGLNLLIKNADTPLFSGTELQAFQVNLGLSRTQMGNLGLTSQLTLAIGTLLSMGFADKVKNRVRANVWLTAAMAIYPLGLVIICLGPAILRQTSVAYGAMFGLELAEKTVMALLGTIFATLYVRTISNGIRGRFTGIIGIAGGIVGMICGLISSWALKEYGYPHGFVVAFGLAVVLLVGATIAVRHVREIPELCVEKVEPAAPAAPSPPGVNVWNVIRMREFRLLAPPNILRGLGEGAGYFAMAVGMKHLHLGNEFAGYTTSLVYLAGILGTLSIGFTVDRFGPGRVLLGADTMIALSLMGIVLAPSPLIFLLFFLMWQVNSTIDGYTVPLAHYAIVPIPVIGAFSGMRLMMLYGTSAITVRLAGGLLDSMSSPVPVFAGCAILKLITGILYWYAFNKGKKEIPLERVEA